MINYEIRLLPWQVEALINQDARIRVIPKGRRLGYTQGCAYYCIISALQGRYKRILWGDTITANIRKYYSVYFEPTLKKLPSNLYEYHRQDNALVIKGATIDFRSADRPENWEGLGYDLVILNEAGIILRNAYLWDNAVRPMLLDNPNSVAIIGGTPKGMYYRGQPHKYYELMLMAQERPDGWTKTYTTYDNPLISKESIEEMIRELPEAVVDQEIYGKFIDIDESVLISMASIKVAATRPALPLYTYLESHPAVLGIDVGWANDPSAWVLRVGPYVHDYGFVQPRRDDRLTASDLIDVINHYQPDYIAIDQGYATGVESYLMEAGYPVTMVPFGARPSHTGKDKYANRRVEMYDRLRQSIDRELILPDEPGLHAALASQTLTTSSRGLMMLDRKEHIKDALGDKAIWLNVADALALTFAEHWGVKGVNHGEVVTAL